MTNEVRCKIKHRNALLRRFRKNKTEINLNLYKTARNDVVSLTKKAKQKYFDRLNTELSQSVGNKKWHKIVNQFLNKGECSRFPPIHTEQGLIFNSELKANVLNEHFCNITKIDCLNMQLPQFKLKTNAQLNSIKIDETEVLVELKSLNIGKAIGPDKISPVILKNCCYVLCSSIAKLFQKIVDHAIYPESWKVANVLPLFKSGDPSIPSNYRPISITSVLSKTFERIVHKQMYEYVMINKLISPCQSGFIQTDSCTNKLMHFINSVHCILESKYQVAAIFLDIKKAFDKVWHKGLIHKLTQLGFGGQLLELIKSYLYKRRQCVVIDGFQSTMLELFDGVPEGGVLSTLLFIIFINDITECIRSSASLFADDTSIYSKISSIDDENALALQNDLKSIEKWAKLWCIEFNPLKSKCIIFHRGNSDQLQPRFEFFQTTIELVNNYTYLGVILDNKLSWKSHIDQTVSRCKMMLNIMKHFKYILSRHTLKVMYIAHVRSILDYSDMLLTNLSAFNERKLEQVQYHAMLTVSGCVFGTSETRLHKELGWNTLAEFRRMHRLIFIYKVQNKLVPNYLRTLLPIKKVDVCQEHRNLQRLRLLSHRNPHPLDFVESTGSEFYNHRPIAIAIKDWNLLPGNIKESESLFEFKANIKRLQQLDKVKYFDCGNRYISCIHTQLRLNVNSLNNSLYVRQLNESPLCSCQEANETVQHFFLFCPKYEFIRSQLFLEINQMMGNSFMYSKSATAQLSLLLDGDKSKNFHFNVKLGKLIHQYIFRSKRFKR